MNKNRTELEGAQPSAQNDQAQLRAAQSENNTKDESGALAAAPCSAPVEFALAQSKKSGQELLSSVKHLNDFLLPSQTPAAAHL